MPTTFKISLVFAMFLCAVVSFAASGPPPKDSVSTSASSGPPKATGSTSTSSSPPKATGSTSTSSGPPKASTKPKVSNNSDQGDVNGEVVFWQSIAASKSCADYQAYSSSFPNGTFINLARARESQYCQQIETPVTKTTDKAKSNLDGVWVGDMQGQKKGMLVLSVSDKQNIVGKYSVIAITGSAVSCEDGLISGQKTSESKFVFQVASVPGGGGLPSHIRHWNFEI